MLSLYLDKVHGCFGVGGQDGSPKYCTYDLLKMSGAFNYSIMRTPFTAPSFSDFVEMVVNLTIARDICELDHHLCKQVQGCLFTDAKSLRVLKLENEASWFSCLVEKFNLSSVELRGKQWLEWKHRPCFYTTKGPGCTLQRVSEIISARNVGSFHATGANTAINKFYDPQTVTRVRLLYADDFKILGYPDTLPESSR